MNKYLLSIFVVALASVFIVGSAHADVAKLEMVKQKALNAAKLIEAEGDACFDKLKDPAGEYNTGEEYVWIHNLDGIMIFHPVKTSLIGQPLLDYKDANGLYIFVAFNEIAEKNGAGWVSYVWPKPGQQTSTPKASYLVLVPSKKYVVGCGTYDVTAADIKAKFPQDPLYEE